MGSGAPRDLCGPSDHAAKALLKHCSLLDLGSGGFYPARRWEDLGTTAGVRVEPKAHRGQPSSKGCSTMPTTNEPAPRIALNVSEAAAATGCSTKTIRRMIADKRLPSSRLKTTRGKGRVVIKPADLEALLVPGVADVSQITRSRPCAPPR